jgi:hypothetical protein
MDYSYLIREHLADDQARDDLVRTTLHSHHQPYDTLTLKIRDDNRVSLVIDTTYTSNDGTPEDVWHRRTLRFGVNGNPDPDALAKLLADDGAASRLIGRVIAGHRVEWDGSNNVGRLSDDAQDAADTLGDTLAGVPQSSLAAWDAGEWLLSSMSHARVLESVELDVDASEEQIAAVAARLVQEARRDKVVLNAVDMEQTLCECIDRVRADRADAEEGGA